MAIVTPDRRYIVVRDRLWRAANPALTDSERAAHTRRLMRARRAVRAALEADDKAAESRARRTVHKAKVALGERGPVWWSDGSPDLNRRKIGNTGYAAWWQSMALIRDTILHLLNERDVGKSICPSEVARIIKPVGWRSLMPGVREVVRELARAGVVEVTQKQKRLSPEDEWRGPIRIAFTKGLIQPAR